MNRVVISSLVVMLVARAPYAQVAPRAARGASTTEIMAEIAAETLSDKGAQARTISSLSSTHDSLLAGVAARWTGSRFGVNGRARIGHVTQPAASNAVRDDGTDLDVAIRAERPNGVHAGYVHTAFRADVIEPLTATVQRTNVMRSSFQGPEIGVRSQVDRGRWVYSVDVEGYPWLLERKRHTFQLTGEPARQASHTDSALGLSEEAALGAHLPRRTRIEGFGRLRLIYSRRGDPLAEPEGMSHITLTYGARLTVVLAGR